MHDESTPASTLREGWLTSPHGSRLAETDPQFGEIIERHRASVEVGLPTYVDPRSGFSVFTAAFLAKRGDCCESGCRHCPFVI